MRPTRDELARASRLTLLNSGEGTLSQGKLQFTMMYDLKKPSSEWDNAFGPVRLEAMNAAEISAAEAALEPQSDGPIRLLVIARDESVRRVKLDISKIEDGAGYDADGSLLLHRDTRALQFVVRGELLYSLERPAVPPTIDAIMLQEQPLRLALRPRGLRTPMPVQFEELSTGKTHWVGNMYVRPGDEDPCWFVITRPRERDYPGAPPLTLHVLDVFYHWRFKVPDPH